MISPGPYRPGVPNADLPGPGDMADPPDPEDPYEPGPYTCTVCGHQSRFPYCYCTKARPA